MEISFKLAAQSVFLLLSRLNIKTVSGYLSVKSRTISSVTYLMGGVHADSYIAIKAVLFNVRLKAVGKITGINILICSCAYLGIFFFIISLAKGRSSDTNF